MSARARAARGLLLFCLAAGVAGTQAARGAEERIKGVLEATAREGACAQITDALHDIYYVVKTPDAEKSCRALIGKRVVLSGTVEQRGADGALFLNLREAAALAEPKAPAPAPPEDKEKKEGP